MILAAQGSFPGACRIGLRATRNVWPQRLRPRRAAASEADREVAPHSVVVQYTSVPQRENNRKLRGKMKAEHRKARKLYGRPVLTKGPGVADLAAATAGENSRDQLSGAGR